MIRTTWNNERGVEYSKDINVMLEVLSNYKLFIKIMRLVCRYLLCYE